MKERLLELQEKIFQHYHQQENGFHLVYSPRIYFFESGDLYEIIFYGEGYDDDPSVKADDLGEGYNYGYCALLDFLTVQENAEKVSVLRFGGPDSGANGTRSWDFSRLVHSDVRFTNLLEFEVALTDPGDHNTSIIDEQSSYEENGTIARLVSRMPRLETLIVPSAPDRSFFDLEDLPIIELKVQAGYDHQNFIGNLADSSNLKELRALDYSEKFDRFNDFTDKDLTSFESYKNLFRSDAFRHSPNSFHFKLRYARLTKEQLFELQEINPIQFLYIDVQPGHYVSHIR
ncbi:MAG: hypothetical protein LBQ60_07610 [Bacteroidales bacterium]|jgi:hypothetical protein|nr:hypothetical protein [Bacteroidales bacterium]